MSNQIKDVLEHQAASVSGVDIEQRMAGVKAQVRARRARRNSGIAAGVAVALMSFGAMNGVPFGGGVQAASRPAQLAGHDVPGTTSSLGYGFRYAEGKQGDGKVTLKVKGASTARMLRFAADSGDVVVMGLDERPMVLKKKRQMGSQPPGSYSAPRRPLCTLLLLTAAQLGSLFMTTPRPRLGCRRERSPTGKRLLTARNLSQPRSVTRARHSSAFSYPG